MNARCRLLAHPTRVPAYRCPTGLRTFHYHGIVPPSMGALVVATMQGICSHRHRDLQQALACTERHRDLAIPYAVQRSA